MNEGKSDRRENAHRISHIESTPHRRTASASWRAWPTRTARNAAIAALCIWTTSYWNAALAQHKSMLDERVTQQSVADTICKPGYADTVSPPLDEMLAHKNQLLAERGIDADDSTDYALDRRVPIVLGGSPDALENFDLLPWGGHRGERRKELLTAKLKRCVCAGKMSLSAAQAAIAGDWPAQYAHLRRASCEDDQPGRATDSDDDGS
ncbi:hypothetical protein [Paraburkholderia rhizosphaerae]|uniref:Uncharacterized protein n=1 Tax=Paraburkholderia rhizosphaerae TaxID=480658 RepID=A0A4R8L8B2_9BURK|nr:hypothetical protein [Paraburkholderia rhizosphaerae]TDY38279.1 hypothetical protein BX592_13216 [Paraburkholderia rhizosphaerae]